MTVATDPTTAPTAPEAARRAACARENLDLARFRELDVRVRALRAAARDGQELLNVKREALRRNEITWQGYASRLEPHRRDLAEVLISLEPDPEQLKRAEAKVLRRFPRGLRETILRQRDEFARLLAEHGPASERAQHLGVLVQNLADFLRERGLLETS